MTGGFVPGGSTLLLSHLFPFDTSTPPITIIFGTAGGWPLDGYAKSCGYWSTSYQTVNTNGGKHNVYTYRIFGAVSGRCNRLHESVISFSNVWSARSSRESAYQQTNTYTLIEQ